MTRTEFLDKLKEALKGSLSDREVQENVEYYAQYIAEETRKEKSEEEILSMLGDPWILARTIINASDGTDRETVYGSGQDTAYTQYRTDRRYDQQKNGRYEEEKRRVHTARAEYLVEKTASITLRCLGDRCNCVICYGDYPPFSTGIDTDYCGFAAGTDGKKQT